MARFSCCFGSRSGGDKGSKVEDAKAAAATAEGKGQKQQQQQQEQQQQKKGGGKGTSSSAVLVEFFTSQGCSSCPPADLVMSRLAQEGAGVVPVVVLAYHVDIWDHLGWRDPFGSSAWSLRQRTYAEVLQQDSICTPQAVVQGAAHCIPSTAGELGGLIAAAKRFPPADLHLAFSRPAADQLKVTGFVVPKLKIEDDSKVDVMVALFEDNLVTMCSKGENIGRTLTNDSVVRALERLCTLEHPLPAKKGKGDSEVMLPLWQGFGRARAGVAVFLQNQRTKQVYGAQRIELPENL